jgi:hypothetical protein
MGSLDEDTWWVELSSSISMDEQEQLAGLCERVWKRNKRNIPYGFRYSATKFAYSGEIEKGEDEFGLTCATFVLAVFASLGIKILDLSSWPADLPAYHERFAEIRRLHEKYGAPKEALEAMAAQMNAVRYSPLEVAAGSMEGTLPVTHAQASSQAQVLLTELQARMTARPAP